MGRFAKRFSGERPSSLGFELTFLSEFKRVVWRVLGSAERSDDDLYKSSTRQRAILWQRTLNHKRDSISCEFSLNHILTFHSIVWYNSNR